MDCKTLGTSLVCHRGDRIVQQLILITARQEVPMSSKTSQSCRGNNENKAARYQPRSPGLAETYEWRAISITRIRERGSFCDRRR